MTKVVIYDHSGPDSIPDDYVDGMAEFMESADNLGEPFEIPMLSGDEEGVAEKSDRPFGVATGGETSCCDHHAQLEKAQQARHPKGVSNGGQFASSFNPVSASKTHSAVNSEMNDRQKEAFDNYAGSMFRDVNPRLRQGKPPSREDKKDVEEMDKVFASSSSSADVVVYRGVSSEAVEKMVPGSTFVDGGFVSTSSSKQTASNFARGDGSAVMEIRVPKGSKAVSLINNGAFSKAEKEVLLNRGGKFKVVSFKKGNRFKPGNLVVEYEG